jgi:manganese transport protein
VTTTAGLLRPEPSTGVGARIAAVAGSRARAWYWLGPAFVASMAYVDPGNFGTNFVAGSASGYTLVWVVVIANVTAMFVQALSAKLGLATQRSLAENCRETYSRATARTLWLQSELMAVATEVAEIVGGAIALQLLFGLPIIAGGVVTAVASTALLMMQSRGRRRFEIAVVLFIIVVVGSLVLVATVAPISAAGAAGGLAPHFTGSSNLLLATGIIGATVMPHVVYLHSSLVADLGELRVPRRRVLRVQRAEIVVALGIVGAANIVMLLIAAATRSSRGDAALGSTNSSLVHVHHVIGAALGHPAATAFALGLLASGLASASVGTLAGQSMMQGFLRRSIPLGVRRAVTIIPALGILIVGVDPTTALVLSQVVLSVSLPFALIPLVRLTGSGEVMGDLRNRRATTGVAWCVSAMVIGLNAAALAAAAAA